MKFQCHNNELGKKIAEALLDIEAIKLSPTQPFTWASGWKSPIYCDNRLSLSFPEVRTLVKNALKDVLVTHFPDAEVIAGVATAGIPQGALLADEAGLPFIYVRSKSKSHGLANQIEGIVEKGQKVLVIEDLVSTGGSSLAAVNALMEKGTEVLGMASIFTYGFPVAKDNFGKQETDLVYLSEYSILLDLAIEKGVIDEDMKKTLDDWRQNPSKWSP